MRGWVTTRGYVIAYVRSSAAKDSLAVRNLVLALAAVDPHSVRFAAHIVGAGPEHVGRLLPAGLVLPPGVTVHGWVSRQEAVDILAASDVSIVQRDPSRRYARAGFPSKVAGSLLLGVPVMTNLTSDLGHYLVDGRHAILLDGDDVSAVIRGLRRASPRTTWSSHGGG